MFLCFIPLQTDVLAIIPAASYPGISYWNSVNVCLIIYTAMDLIR